MKSMTGFGRAIVSLNTHDVVIEIFAVNRRNLEIGISLPKDWQDIDPHIQRALRKKLLRGRINVSVKVNASRNSGSFDWDQETVSATLTSLRQLAVVNDVPFEPDPALLYRVATSQSDGKLPLWQDHKDVFFQGIDAALDEFIAMRAKEGSAMQADMLAHLESLAQIMDRVEPLVPEQVPLYRDSLLKRLHDFGLEIDLNDERVLKEIALYAEKCNVAEELSRLRSHLDQMHATLEEDGAIGRKLEFLLQEIFREINTLGNKSSKVEIIQAVLSAKSEVEKLREQSLNVE
ncbi:MAG: YicC family protein [Opitutae bacterium]|nr:YicC family protein [Opitutae bacterium]